MPHPFRAAAAAERNAGESVIEKVAANRVRLFLFYSDSVNCTFVKHSHASVIALMSVRAQRWMKIQAVVVTSMSVHNMYQELSGWNNVLATML